MSKYTYNQTGWKTKRSGRKLPQGQLVKNLLLAAIAAGFALSLVLVVFVAIAARNLPNPNSLTQRVISQTTKIYDRTGNHLLYEIFGNENRTLKKVRDSFCKDDKNLETDPNGIPLFALQATITAEDRNFCKHNGFDVKGFARAIFQNLRGNRVGGSTLTQQLVKNAILSNEKTLGRKIKELVLSLELERRYSKDEILQIYFNEIPYGSTYYGIEAAAQNFFAKSVGELSLPEAATLAALPKAPTTYINNPDRLVARRNYILTEMQSLGFITNEELEEALALETPLNTRVTNINAPHFVMFVKEQLEEKYGRKKVEEGGLKVVTTLNWDYQQVAEEEVKKGVDERGERYGFSNASLVAIDPKSGHILSMVGSKDFFDDEIDGQVNVATRLRQPGSSFKPIVYAKAFELGYTPNTVLWDVLTDFPTVTGTYTPHNYDDSERGPIRVRDAIQLSLNIPAVKMIYLVGVENTLDFATSLGYGSFGDHSAFGLSLVLGGGEVRLLEHVSAYGVFANEGVHYDPVAILRVEDAEGAVLDEWKQKKGDLVVEENVARIITHVLSDNAARAPVFGQRNALQLGDRPVAAKTGTTNDNHDAWLIGYTPSLVAGVWGGNNDNTEMSGKGGGSTVAAPIWNAFMRRVIADNPIEPFTPPVIKQTGKPVLDGQISSTTVVIDKASGKLATQYTPESFREKRTFASYHSILHDVNKNDPLGAVPNEPKNDPYYEPWESAIEKWLKKKEEETGKSVSRLAPPTQSDDIHIPENFPVVRIINPSDGAPMGRAIDARVSASAPRGISRVEFYIDGLFIGSSEASPFSLVATLPNTVERGFHTLKAVAYDDVENQGSTTVGVQITQDSKDASISLVDPRNGQTIEFSAVPFVVVVSLKNPEQYSWLRVYADPIGSGSRILVTQQANPGSIFPTAPWTLPMQGSYALTAEALSKTGDIVKTAGVIVNIVESSSSTTTEKKEAEIFLPENQIELF